MKESIATQGKFQAVESFAIRSREEFYIIGRLEEGELQANWFVNVQFNPSFAMSVKIKEVETVEIAAEQENYQLLIVAADSQDINLLLGLNIGSELLGISIEGAE